MAAAISNVVVFRLQNLTLLLWHARSEVVRVPFRTATVVLRMLRGLARLAETNALRRINTLWSCQFGPQASEIKQQDITECPFPWQGTLERAYPGAKISLSHARVPLAGPHAGATRAAAAPGSHPASPRTPRDQAGREPRDATGGATSPPPPEGQPGSAEVSRAGCSPARREAAAAAWAGRARDGAVRQQHPRGRTPTDLVEAALGREDGDVAVEAGAGASGHGGRGEGGAAEGLTACRVPPPPRTGSPNKHFRVTHSARAPSRSAAAAAHARGRSGSSPPAPLASMRAGGERSCRDMSRSRVRPRQLQRAEPAGPRARPPRRNGAGGGRGVGAAGGSAAVSGAAGPERQRQPRLPPRTVPRALRPAGTARRRAALTEDGPGGTAAAAAAASWGGEKAFYGRPARRGVPPAETRAPPARRRRPVPALRGRPSQPPERAGRALFWC